MNAAVPTRHPARPLPIPGVVRIFANIIGAEPPSEEQWRQLGESLLVGDEPMDRVVEWMHSVGMGQGRRMFEQALDNGIASVPNAPEPLRDFFDLVENAPDWVDWDKIRRAQVVFRSGGADGLYVARDVSLLGGYMFSGFNKTLLRTGALKKGSNRRFAETMQWAMDLMHDDGLHPGGIGFKSTIRVRLIHAMVRRYVAEMPDWRTEDWGIPVNQTDMLATLLGALVAPGLGGLGMGIFASPAESEASAHMTRYVGWLIGVEEQWLPRNSREAVALLANTLAALSNPDETTQMLSKPMAEDPLIWNYKHFQWLRRRIAKNQHLSVTQTFLGPSAMRTLGLSPYVLPWYPVVRFPINFVRSTAAIVLPGGRDRAAARGWREMQDLMVTMIGERPTIGESAAHLTRAA
ncbi:oxygenase MpaB family protein [Smaragdicoccus niigatensis]|uniref:oxygenase MpaB family protein n=1 Tax=Smaragdicoccus niigatensis TaxID=359359 RepID=UPI00037F5633|nr:oxygenase MpaB family protein [Smaragdicoccus niigatensis]